MTKNSFVAEVTFKLNILSDAYFKIMRIMKISTYYKNSWPLEDYRNYFSISIQF